MEEPVEVKILGLDESKLRNIFDKLEKVLDKIDKFFEISLRHRVG